MDSFNKLYIQIMEDMVAGGPSSIFGNPVSGEIGSHGGELNPKDSYAPNANYLPKILNRRIIKRPRINRKK